MAGRGERTGAGVGFGAGCEVVAGAVWMVMAKKRTPGRRRIPDRGSASNPVSIDLLSVAAGGLASLESRLKVVSPRQADFKRSLAEEWHKSIPVPATWLWAVDV